MVGAPGFEPGNGGTKNRCLTAWRRPNDEAFSSQVDTLGDSENALKLYLSFRPTRRSAKDGG